MGEKAKRNTTGLRNLADLPPDVRREIQSRGGKASAAKRKEAKMVREALLELLGSIKVKRAAENPEVLPVPCYQFSAGEDSKDTFTITAGGNLITSSNCYEFVSSSPDEVWSRLEAICGVSAG